MGQKIHPTGFRIGVYEDWRSRWYANKHEFSELLVEDFKIRKFIKKKYAFAGIPKIEIERTRDAVKVILFTARPEIDAQLISEDIAEQLKKRSSFRRTIKRALEQTMDGGAKGVKVQLSGRLGGSEMSRTEGANLGSIPLSTLRAKIDYGFSEAKTAQGHIGIKVWVNQGDYLKPDESMEGAAPKRPRRRVGSGPGGGGPGGGGGGGRR